MLNAYHRSPNGLSAGAAPDADDVAGRIAGALWVDLARPAPTEVAAVAGLGIEVPTLADMEEIEVSNRLYRKDDVEYLTVVLPGTGADGHSIAGPVAFILGAGRLITVRHHDPLPFKTFPGRAGQSTAGCATPDHLFLGLIEEIVARLADLLEAAGAALDAETRRVFGGDGKRDPDVLQATLSKVGEEGERIGRVRLALLTLERALTFFDAPGRPSALGSIVKGLLRDIVALAEQCDFLSSRIGLTVDATLGMINLVQTATVRIVSVAAVLFLPPTLVASVYGMNFAVMPELQQPWGYPAALGLMLASAVVCFLIFKWKKWL